MSNSNDSKTDNSQAQPLTPPENPTPAAAETPANKAKRWSFIQNDLEKALDAWQELEKAQSKLSPEEEQFEKIKTIIGQLKSKIEQF
jgi:hypothetical protein